MDRSGEHEPTGFSTIVDLSRVTKNYETPAGEFVALDDLDLQIVEGELVAIVGKSGSGKSTLLNLVTAIDHPSRGNVTVAGTELHELTENEAARWRGRNVGLIFQFFQLLPTLTAVENILLPMDFVGRFSKSERRGRALELLRRVGIEDQADKLPTQLSGGQQQRVAIARSLANDPPLIVADEPTGNLDSKTSDAIVSLFEQLAQAGSTVVMVTHDHDIADRMPRRVELADGVIVADSMVGARPVRN